MGTAMTIEQFNALLTSEKDEGPLLTALRKLTTLKKPEDVAVLAVDPLAVWGGWH